MAEQPPKPRRRPIDALFGDSDAPAVPSYAVDPPQPAKTVQPPPPAPAPSPDPVPPPSGPVPVLPPAPEEVRVTPAAPKPETPSGKPFGEANLSDVPTFIPPAEPVRSTFASEPPAYTRPAYAAPPPTAAPPESSPVEYGAEVYFAYIPEAIRDLYERVHNELSDSPKSADYCMKILLQARDAYLKQDYAAAEYYVEATRAKFQRSARSTAASRSIKMWLLWIWELVGLVGFSSLIVITFIPSLTLFGLPVSPDVVTLLRALAWGGLGGVLGALYNLPWFIQHREYDPAYNTSYFVRPLVGVLVGGILYLISQAGIIAGNAVIPALPGSTGPTEIPVGPIFLYLFATLAAFKQEYVLEFFDNVLRAVFRLPRLPDELQLLPPPPKK